MKNKLENELERFTSNYCWENLQGNETWSNNFHNCTVGGAEIARKYFKKIVLDMLNEVRSKAFEERIPKLGRTPNFEKELSYKASIEVLEKLLNKLK